MGVKFDHLHRQLYVDRSLESTFARYWRRIANPCGEPVLRVLPSEPTRRARPIIPGVRIGPDGVVWTRADFSA